MHEGVKEVWIEALESDKYEQGRGTLTRVKGGEQQHCCLGVLMCELRDHPDLLEELGIARIDQLLNREGDTVNYHVQWTDGEWETETTVLPNRLARRLDIFVNPNVVVPNEDLVLYHDSGSAIIGENLVSVAVLNDGVGEDREGKKDFKYIAERIKESL
jgi:hypothetical protein